MNYFLKYNHNPTVSGFITIFSEAAGSRSWTLIKKSQRL